jgi:hypothetical protein
LDIQPVKREWQVRAALPDDWNWSQQSSTGATQKAKDPSVSVYDISMQPRMNMNTQYADTLRGDDMIMSVSASINLDSCQGSSCPHHRSRV